MESLERIRQKTEEFMAEALRIDEDAAAVINQNKENFYNKYNYLKPDAEKSDWEAFWDDAAKWCKEHWQEIVTTVGIIVGAALAIAAVVTTGGAALVPLLTALGVAAGTAANISLAVAAIAVVSTIGAAALNIADTWGNIDNPILNTLQSVLNWTSTISNGLYSIGMLYNSIQYKSGRNFNHERKGNSGTIEGGTDVWDMTEGGGTINGREYSQHAMERMAPDTPSVRAELSRRAEALAESKGLQVGTPEYYQFCQKYVDPRNIPPSVIEDAIRKTIAVPGHTAGTFVHQTVDVTVIVNETGKVITVMTK